MHDFFKTWLGHIFLGLITLDHLWDRIYPLFEKFGKAEQFIERRIGDRRKTMEKYLKLIPLLSKLASDLEAASKSPEDAAVIADVKALIADIAGTPPAA